MTSPLQQKLKITGPVVITANRLDDGAVVYRTADGGWITLAVISEDHFWQAVCDGLDLAAGLQLRIEGGGHRDDPHNAAFEQLGVRLGATVVPIAERFPPTC